MENISWWSKDIKYNPTPRQMLNISNWNTFYSIGTFIKRSHLKDICTHPLINNWIREEKEESSEEEEDSPEILTLIDIYNDISYDQMRNYQKEQIKLSGESKSVVKISESDLIQSWAAKSCAYQKKLRGKKVCKSTDVQIEDYEKCSDHSSNSYKIVHTTSATANYDIRIETFQMSLEQMLDMKGVKGNECLEDVRRNHYSWLQTMNKLYELCNGEYDESVVCEDIIINYDRYLYVERVMDTVDVNSVQLRLSAEGNDITDDILQHLMISSKKEDNHQTKKHPKNEIISIFIYISIAIGSVVILFLLAFGFRHFYNYCERYRNSTLSAMALNVDEYENIMASNKNIVPKYLVLNENEAEHLLMIDCNSAASTATNNTNYSYGTVEK